MFSDKKQLQQAMSIIVEFLDKNGVLKLKYLADVMGLSDYDPRHFKCKLAQSNNGMFNSAMFLNIRPSHIIRNFRNANWEDANIFEYVDGNNGGDSGSLTLEEAIKKTYSMYNDMLASGKASVTQVKVYSKHIEVSSISAKGEELKYKYPTSMSFDKLSSMDIPSILIEEGIMIPASPVLKDAYRAVEACLVFLRLPISVPQNIKSNRTLNEFFQREMRMECVNDIREYFNIITANVSKDIFWAQNTGDDYTLHFGCMEYFNNQLWVLNLDKERIQ